MKPFIVSMGIIIVGLSGLVFRSDLTQYVLLQEHLQALTEEATAYAALACTETEDGHLHFSQVEVNENVNYMITYASNYMPCFRNGTIYPEIISPVDETNSVTVKLQFVSNKDLFRLPFISIKEISHTSCYEWVEIPEESLESDSFL